MSTFDGDRQRIYFERTNQRLQTKIFLDQKREKIEETHRIQEQLSLMREISSYSVKVMHIQGILSDLDIVTTLATEMNVQSNEQIIDAIQLRRGSHFLQEKQLECHSILNKQHKRIQLLRDSIDKLEKQSQDNGSYNLHTN